MHDLDGRVVAVSGAGRGIGRQLAISVAAAGATVLVNDPDRGDGSGPSLAEQVAETIGDAGGSAVADHGDVSVAADVEAMVAAAVDRFGRLDGVVNNAGILRDRMIFSLEEEDWDAVIRVHLRGHFLLTRAACRHWRGLAKESGEPAGGSVVCITSEAGIYGNAGQCNYSAAKGGILAFGLTAAREMQRYGVSVNVVAPRARTRMTEGAFSGFGEDDGPHPWDPENVAPMIRFLLSKEGHAYTGQVFVAGGGVLQRIAPPSVETEIETGPAPPSPEEVAAFVEEAVGPTGLPPAFPDLGLSPQTS